MENVFKKNLYRLLKKDSRLWDEEKKEINETLLKDKIDKLDEKIIELLLSDKKSREKFFIKVKDVFVLKQSDLKFFIDENKLDNSYTQYQNKIGLRIGNRLLSERDEVVLDWPFKDCVLEGGMTKEDQKRSEIFFNEVLAKDEIDRLEDPKAFVGWKRYTTKGKEKIKEIKRDKDGTIRENLIIKGNNLLALYSLKEQFIGKVKLIYIDPPYNRDNERDDFLYNDTFKHSTWLVFMKNRLKVAKKLLAKEGVIWISISDNEGHYLKVLCDEVFDRKNFVADVIWNSTKSVTNTAVISDAHTHNLLYAKDIDWLKKNRTEFRMAANESKFSNPDNDLRGKWVADPFQVGGIRPNQLYPITNPKTGEIYKPLPGNSWKNEKIVFEQLMADNRIVFGVSGEACPQRKRFWTEAKERGEVTTTLWDDLPTTTNATRHLKYLFGEKVFENPKPEGLIQRIIKLSTKEGDIVLDFFAGSGTTAATSIKMKRQFITCEQMDYVNNVTVERLKKIITGEQGGISKAVDWQGGGDFVYLELAKWNEEAKEKILKAKSLGELEKIFDELYERYFLNYNVKTKEFKEKILKEEEFKKIDLKKQKKLFVEMLDMNQMYVNFSERADKKYNLSKEDVALSEEFYNTKE